MTLIRSYILLIIAVARTISCLAQTDTVEVGKGTLVGQIVYGESYLPNTFIAAYKNNKLIKKTRSDSNGEYHFRGLAGGTYKLKVVTAYSDILVSRAIVVADDDSEIANCDEFFLINKKEIRRKLTYPDTPLKQDIDSMVVRKEKREMYVYGHHKLLKVYHVCLGFTPVGAKHFEGDGKTPEGLYKISDKNVHSEYHKSLGISYPSAEDVKYARKAARPAGGNVKIHGLPNGEGQNKADYIYDDWTWGCIAVTDQEIDELFTHVQCQTSILILP